MILYYSQICIDDCATAIIKSVLKEHHTHLRELSQLWMESTLLFRAAVSLVLRFSQLCFGMAEEKQYQAVVERGEWQYFASPLVVLRSSTLHLCLVA
jgi:anaerobic C4-dicarboxylate transporter